MGGGAVDTRLSHLGGSLPVPSVQAMVDSGRLTEVPSRYIRPELYDADNEISDAVLADDVDDVYIPVVDMARLLDPGSSEQEAANLKMACEDWGFFQLINHGVPDEVAADIKDNIQEFFKLPLEVRMKIAQPPGVIEGYGQAFVFSEDQKLDWADMLYLYSLPSSVRNYHLWPEQPRTFRAVFEAYSHETKRVSGILFQQMAKNLGLDDPEKLTGMMEDGVQSMRMSYYPPCPLAHDKVIGLYPHSDAAALTLLLQINEVPGLQIRRHGKWLPVYPLPGALIVNVGDAIEICTNGKYKSIEHRAMVNKDKERLSVATFHMPAMDSTIGPLPDFCRGNPPRFKSVGAVEYTRLLLTSKLDGKNFLDGMKLDV